MNACRLCLGDFLLLRKDYNIHNLKDKLRMVFSFEVPQRERLSEVVCPDCVRTLCKFYDYASKVKQNQQRLLQQIEDENMHSETSSLLFPAQPPPSQLIPDDEIKVEITSENVFAENISSAPDSVQAAKKQNKSIAPPGRFQKNLISRHMDMTCDICQEDQYTFQKLEAHFKKYHGKQFYISCCGQKLINEQMIAGHLDKHMTMVTNKETRDSSNSWERRVSSAFGSILTDFKKDLEDYEPLPNMALALNGDAREQQKLYDVQDYLLQTYFNLDCELCGYKLNNPDDRRMHFRDIHPKEKYFVSCCGQRFSIRISIMRHLNRHWKFVANGSIPGSTPKTAKLETEDSPEMITQSNKANFQRLMQAAYGPLMNEFYEDLMLGGFSPPSKLPETKTTGQLRLLHHMQDFLIAKHCPLNCELCHVEISTYMGRRDHFRIGHPKEKMYIQCCGIKISTRQKIIIHLLRHRKGLPTEPQIRFAPEHTYEKHEQDDAVIEGYYKMDCEMCDYTGSSYLGLRGHFQKCHKEEGFFITCCNRRMKTKYHILEHIAAHQKPGSLKCDHCEATFSTERMRKAHVSRKHVSDEEKIFRCEHCVESFATRNLLVLHSYKHELMTCDICGAQMKRCSLRVHRLNIHKLGEEIVCHVCAKVFHSKHMFNAHYRKAHLGIRKKYKKKSRAKKRPPPEVELAADLGNPSGTTAQLSIEPLFMND
ncbi:zinc finger protein 26-like [Ochlerotatus camptorhynchus]|uniref:zinc finger protein 26-like n=1 Tax=Ochlerotatus camptorhynchus TaxID=644619 RepID=UPI0031E18E9C